MSVTAITPTLSRATPSINDNRYSDRTQSWRAQHPNLYNALITAALVAGIALMISTAIVLPASALVCISLAAAGGLLFVGGLAGLLDATRLEKSLKETAAARAQIAAMEKALPSSASLGLAQPIGSINYIGSSN
jgi:hypothetical protein